MKRLPKVFYHHAHLPPHLITQLVVEDFKEFNHGSLQGKDDITFLVMQIEPESAKRLSLELATDFKELKSLQEKAMEFLIDQESYLLLTCLKELVVNAMEHGNKMDPKKMVSVHIKVMYQYIQVVVEDEGEGFNWQEKLNGSFDLEGHQERGRGIPMTQLLAQDLYYNREGNQATLVMNNERRLIHGD